MDDAVTAKLLEAGKLSQRCPRCGLVEAAGYACSADWTATGPADWFKPEASEAKRAALAAHRTRRFRQSGRPKASRAMSTATAPFSSVLGL